MKEEVHIETHEERIERLLLLTKEINKGLKEEGRVFVGRSTEERIKIVRVPTGILALDLLLGGGFPRKRYVEFYGSESCAKTTAALLTVRAFQRRGLVCGWVEGEEFDEEWANKLGVDLDQLFRFNTYTGGRRLQAAMSFVGDGNPDLMVFDSIQAIGTAAELGRDVDEEAFAGGGAPQMWGRTYRRVMSIYGRGKVDTGFIGISQVRSNIGGYSPAGKPDPEPTDIKVIKHWKSASIQFKKGEPTYMDAKSEKRKIVSREFKMRCVKNKTAATEGQAGSFEFVFRGDDGRPFGVDRVDAAVRFGKLYGLITQRGAITEGFGIRTKGGKGISGEERYVLRLREHPEKVREIRRAVLKEART